MLETVTLKGCKVHFDPKNISKEAALKQAEVRIDELRKNGSQLKNFTAFTPHKGEEWYEKLRRLRTEGRKHGKIHG